MKLFHVVQPSGGLISRTGSLPVYPGEPHVFVQMAQMGDLAQVVPTIPGTFRGSSTTGQLDGAGGGLEQEDARIRAVAEAVERYASCVYSPEQFIWATAEELGPEALDLETLPRCSEAELAHPKCPITAPRKDLPIRWVRGISLTSGRQTWIPAVMVYLHIPPKSPGERFWLPISTGCAAHITLEQALISAICEVVERDAISLVWYQQLAVPRIEFDQLPPETEALVKRLNRSDVQQLFFDATTDMGIPTVYSVQLSPHHPKLAAMVMCSTDLDPGRSIGKVIRESASSRLAMQVPRQHAADLDDFLDLVDGAIYMGQHEHLHAYDFLIQSPTSRRFSNMPVLESGDPAQDLAFLIRHLAAKGCELYAVDLTTDEALCAGLRIVRVVIPQLMPLSFAYRARYLGHPRLWQAPAAMGYPVRSEAEINPWPQPFA